MINNSISIANKLEVINGNMVAVPGCEPTSSFTSVTLAVNQKCNASLIPLGDALAAVPGSDVQMLSNPRKLLFVLPDGPPPKPGCICTTAMADHYQALRDATPTPQEDVPTASPKACDSFEFGKFS